ncbi:uncharacterized protein LOC123538141 [Mercenaria mercenaria]|uniref:uncharacterized protein LOC123538141 n=1 Tax=Mercenaria mercenaria TaxID=6596 RepID=UPI00234E4905|nr:uncharacterized protein LOC123538141 [Mercenaria mercenaria]
MDPAKTSSRRTRKLTIKGQEMYELRVCEFGRILFNIHQTIEENITLVETYKENKTVLGELKQILEEEHHKYVTLSDQLCVYLKQAKTKEAEAELMSHLIIRQSVEEKVKYAQEFVNEQIGEPIEQIEVAQSEVAQSEATATDTKSLNDNNSQSRDNVSVKSNQQQSGGSVKSQKTRNSQSVGKSRSTHSISSSKSKMSQMLITKKSNLETAKIKLKIAEEEEKLKRQQTEFEINVKREQADKQAQVEKGQKELEASLHILQCKKEVLETEAELKVVEEIASLEVDNTELPSEVDNRSIFVKEYIDNLPEITRVDECVISLPLHSNPCTKVVETSMQNKLDNTKTSSSPLENQSNLGIPEPTSQVEKDENNSTPQGAGVSELTKYIMKKDLLLSRLSNFDDRAERYFSWKNSFLNIVKELDVTATEELDLLARWLGPESKRQAVSIRVSNPHDEQNALNKTWERLDERFGAPEQVAESLRRRLESFPKVTLTERQKLYELSDLLSEIASVKDNERYKMSLSYFDSALGVNNAVCKLPVFIQNKWVDHASSYKVQHNVMYPPFHVFVEFVKKMAVRQNDPSFRIQSNDSQKGDSTVHVKQMYKVKSVNTRKTNLETSQRFETKNLKCVIHGDESKHKLKHCRTFQAKSIPEKKEIVQKNGICFKCLNGKHLAKDCKESVSCEKCNSSRHCTTFHIDRPEALTGYGGEHHQQDPSSRVNVSCTEVCGDPLTTGKSCTKTVLVRVYPEDQPDRAITCYAIIDDQSNKSLAKSALFDKVGNNTDTIDYILSSCAGKVARSGKCTSGICVEPFDGSCVLKCPQLIECNEIPDTKKEVATPAVARQYKHLRDIQHLIPEIDSHADVLLLLGRDLLAAHHVIDQRIGAENEPYAQRLRLGWVVVGETCLGMIHRNDQNMIIVNKTNVLFNGRSSMFLPCENKFEIKDTVFQRTVEDDSPGLSREDREFLDMMDKEMTKSESGHIIAPLPFRKARRKLPNNFEQARRRAENLSRDLKRNPAKREHFVEFMKNIFEKKHAEEAPSVYKGEEVWCVSPEKAKQNSCCI